MAIQGAATLIVGAAAGWVFSIISSFVAAVVAINNAVANRAGQLVAKMGGL
jgi:ABC-type phosphate/phosphonate transport system permease subunit